MCGMLKATRLTSPLVWVANCAYIVPIQLSTSFDAGVLCGWGGVDMCGKTENVAEILTRTERLDPRLPAISARVDWLDSCKNLRGKKRKQRHARVSVTLSRGTGYLSVI